MNATTPRLIDCNNCIGGRMHLDSKDEEWYCLNCGHRKQVKKTPAHIYGFEKNTSQVSRRRNR